MNGAVNIASRLRAAALRHPDKPAVVVYRGPDRKVATHTFSQLERDSDDAARGLAASGIGRGSKTLIMLRPGLPFFSCFFALFKVGAVPVFIDPGMGGKRLLECVRALAPEAMVGVPLAHLVRLFRRRSFPGLKTAVTCGRRWFWGGPNWENLKQPGAEPFPIAPTQGNDLAAILFTTGSTGPAKGVEYSHAALDSQVAVLTNALSITPDDKDLATFPGFSLFSVALGMTAVLPDMNPVRPGSAFPPNIIGPILKEGCTFSFGSPALWGRISAYAAERNITLPTLDRVVMAGAPVPAAIHERLLERGVLPAGADTFTPYGATECMPVANISGREVLRETAALTAEGRGVCVGRPAEGVRIEIIRITDNPIPTWRDDLPVPDGEVGEITVASDHASRHYHNHPRADALAKIADGAAFLHRMGDLGRRDAEGRIWFCGRKAHRVRTPGGDMFTIVCEAVFNRHPAVLRSALVGIPAENGFQRPVMVVQLQEGYGKGRHLALTAELLALGRANPATVVINDILFHPAFPTDIRHNAKIRREDLAIWAEGAVAAQRRR